MIFTAFDIEMFGNHGTITVSGADRYGKFNWSGTVEDKSDGWGSNITFESVKHYIGSNTVYYDGFMVDNNTLKG